MKTTPLSATKAEIMTDFKVIKEVGSVSVTLVTGTGFYSESNNFISNMFDRPNFTGCFGPPANANPMNKAFSSPNFHSLKSSLSSLNYLTTFRYIRLLVLSIFSVLFPLT